MAVADKNVSYRIYIVAMSVFVLVFAIIFKLTNLQWAKGAYYRNLAQEQTIDTFVVQANKGNIYSADGSLLATSIPNYSIRFDAIAPTDKNFNENISGLADELAKFQGKSSDEIENELKKARANKNRYFLVDKDLSYSDYVRIKSFPLFKLGAYKGGIIVEQVTVREHPIGKIAERTIGYERIEEASGKLLQVGIEGAFAKYINGKNGKVVKQKIARGQYKPIRDENEIEPQDGYDVISTIDVYIQDIAHHALLKQLQEFNAEHGCVVVMETKTGQIKAISNLGRDSESGNYYETINYAVAESHEPGSTFKLVDMIALLDDKKVDTSAIFNRHGGVVRYRGEEVRDSHEGGPQIISLGRGFEISSNTVLVQAVVQNYGKNPKQFTDRIDNLGLNNRLHLPFSGEGNPVIRHPSDKSWYPNALPWMAFGYGVSVTPLQTLTLYNAVANNGVMVKPQFVSEIKEWNKTIKKYETQVINPSICQPETIKKLRAVLTNVVAKNGATGHKMYSKDFSMAGKTGTAQANYGKNGGNDKYYISSFVGYFPAESPKYSCIVVIHKPDTSNGNYYGADVSGPVFKRIAQKIFTDVPSTNELKNIDQKVQKQEVSFQKYFETAQNTNLKIPNVKGMPAMDAITILENIGLKVKIKGSGKVKNQSLQAGQIIQKNSVIVLELAS